MKDRIINSLLLCAAAAMLCMTGGLQDAKKEPETTLEIEMQSDTTYDTSVTAAVLGSGGIAETFYAVKNAALTIPAEELPNRVGTQEDNDTESVSEIPSTEDEFASEYADLALAHVTNYVNVRSGPNTDSAIVGKIFNKAVAQILETAGENQDWLKIISGNVEGYIKAEFFYYGEEAVKHIEEYVTRYAVVFADRLNVREEPEIDSKRIGYVDYGEKVEIVEHQGDWIQVRYAGNKTGYVSADYVTVEEQFFYAKTLEEEAAELAERRAQEERAAEQEQQAQENVTVSVNPPNTNYAGTDELRTAIVEYAMQFLGNKYVHGGNSLVTGTDCSGFTSLIYKEFGYSVSRTPAGQLEKNGKLIEYSDSKPGDIICYGKSKCTHVALYIGDGKIIHAANSKKGVVIYDADYDNILGVKNLID